MSGSLRVLGLDFFLSWVGDTYSLYESSTTKLALKHVRTRHEFWEATWEHGTGTSMSTVFLRAQAKSPEEALRKVCELMQSVRDAAESDLRLVGG